MQGQGFHVSLRQRLEEARSGAVRERNRAFGRSPGQADQGCGVLRLRVYRYCIEGMQLITCGMSAQGRRYALAEKANYGTSSALGPRPGLVRSERVTTIQSSIEGYPVITLVEVVTRAERA